MLATTNLKILQGLVSYFGRAIELLAEHGFFWILSSSYYREYVISLRRVQDGDHRKTLNEFGHHDRRPLRKMLYKWWQK